MRGTKHKLCSAELNRKDMLRSEKKLICHFTQSEPQEPSRDRKKTGTMERACEALSPLALTDSMRRYHVNSAAERRSVKGKGEAGNTTAHPPQTNPLLTEPRRPP